MAANPTTPKERERICKMYRAKVPTRDIARETHRSLSTIHTILIQAGLRQAKLETSS